MNSAEIAITFLTGLASTSSLFLAAAGLSIIFGVTRLVNFAHGSLYMLGAFIGYTLITRIGDTVVGFCVALVVAALLVGLIGLVIEILLLRRLYHVPELFQLIATFGVILIVQDVALLVWGAQDLPAPRIPGLEGTIDIAGNPYPVYDVMLIGLGPLVLACLWLVFNRTHFGVLVRAATEDRTMLGALGVNQAILFTGVFFLGAALAGLGGAAQLPRGNASLLLDFTILADVFVVVVVGGMGSLGGAFLAAFLISELNTFGVQLWPDGTLVLTFLLMAMVLILRPWGLLGRPEQVGLAEHSTEIVAPPLAAEPLLRGAFAVIVAMLVVLPWFDLPYMLILVADVLIMCLFAQSLQFLLGLGGLVSFGHAAYFGGGAYAAALLVTYADGPFELALLLAPLASGMLALAIGWFCVRLSGVYFAMLTLAFAQVVWSVVFQWSDVTNGDDGLLNIWPSDWASHPTIFYYLVLGLTVGGIGLIRRVSFSPFGYVLRAVRDSRLRADCIGIHAQRQQLLAFSFAGAMAGLAGGVFVFAKGSVFPDEASIPHSFDALLAVLWGGMESVTGPLLGAAALVVMRAELAGFDYWRLTMGLLILLLVLLFPQGLAGIGRAIGLGGRGGA